MFRDFQRFSEAFQRPSQSPSQSGIFLSELQVVLPLIVLPLKTPTTKVENNHVKDATELLRSCFSPSLDTQNRTLALSIKSWGHTKYSTSIS